MGFVAISTTVSGNDGFLKMSRRISTSLDPIGVDLGEMGASEVGHKLEQSDVREKNSRTNAQL